MASSQPAQTLRWDEPGWLDEVTEWVDARVERTGAVERFHAYPWATALRVPTTDGLLWFKACIEELAHEVTTLELIEARRPGVVPRLIAGDRARGWMLLEDAGERMRELDALGRQLERWEEAVALYAQLQLDVARDADRFAAGGVPDRRGTVADGLARLLDDVTSASGEDEIEPLRALVPRVRSEEAELDALGVPFSIQHDDLHDANIFVRDGRYRIIDWGDACVANPLLSLTVMLAVVEYRFEVGAEDIEVVRVRDAYLEPFTSCATRDELVGATALARRVGYACGTIKWYEVERATAADVGLSERLRKTLDVCG